MTAAFSQSRSAGGKTLAVGDGIVYLWDVAAARQIAALSVPTPAVPDDPSNSSDDSTVKAAFSPDGKTLVTGEDHSDCIYLWHAG